jgi:hypothetical protein
MPLLSRLSKALPVVKLGVEECGVVDNFAGEQPIELFVVETMRPLDLAVQLRRR